MTLQSSGAISLANMLLNLVGQHLTHSVNIMEQQAEYPQAEQSVLINFTERAQPLI